ncbi:MAG: hypothetical protein IPJ06_18180 [Saprospiraceae bacterium]|nr:hypothetical protein [Saprospiraceae bacterium]
MAKHNVISLFLILCLIGPVHLLAQVDTVSIHLIDTLLAKVQLALDQQDPGKGLDIIAQAEARALELAGDKSYAYGEAIFQHGRLLRQLSKNDEAEENTFSHWRSTAAHLVSSIMPSPETCLIWPALRFHRAI